jgi:hypothetical protein
LGSSSSSAHTSAAPCAAPLLPLVLRKLIVKCRGRAPRNRGSACNAAASAASGSRRLVAATDALSSQAAARCAAGGSLEPMYSLMELTCRWFLPCHETPAYMVHGGGGRVGDGGGGGGSHASCSSSPPRRAETPAATPVCVSAWVCVCIDA